MSHHTSLGEGEVPFEDGLKSCFWCFLRASSKENWKSLRLWLNVIGVTNWAAVGPICSMRVDKLRSNMTRKSGKYSGNTHHWKEQYGVIKKKTKYFGLIAMQVYIFLFIYICFAISKNRKFFFCHSFYNYLRLLNKSLFTFYFHFVLK